MFVLDRPFIASFIYRFYHFDLHMCFTCLCVLLFAVRSVVLYSLFIFLFFRSSCYVAFFFLSLSIYPSLCIYVYVPLYGFIGVHLFYTVFGVCLLCSRSFALAVLLPVLVLALFHPLHVNLVFLQSFVLYFPRPSLCHVCIFECSVFVSPFYFFIRSFVCSLFLRFVSCPFLCFVRLFVCAVCLTSRLLSVFHF